MNEWPEVKRIEHNARKLSKFHRRSDARRANGLTTRGTVPKRGYPRYRTENFVKEYDPPSQQAQQREARRDHLNKVRLAWYHRRKEKNLMRGLTARGSARKYKRISPVEQAYRELRDSMEIKTGETSNARKWRNEE